MFKKKLLKMVRDEVAKMIQPLKEYVDEPNALDDLCKEMKQKADATHDLLIEVGKTANAVEEDLKNFNKI